MLVLVMALPYVVMEIVRVMKPMIIVQKIACLQVSVLTVKSLIVMVRMNAGQSLGLVMVLKIVKINNMVLT